LSFKFPLEALLSQRHAVESAKRRHFEQAQARLNQTQRNLERREADFAARVNAWDPNHVRSLAELERSIAELRVTARRYEIEAGEAKTALLEAMRDRKALEMLKKRRFAEYAAREARKEERELDEANQA